MTVAKKSPSLDLIDQLLVDYQKPEDILGENGLLKQLTKAVIERALQAEMAAHLGHGKHEPIANAAGNARNGSSRKTLKGEFGDITSHYSAPEIDELLEAANRVCRNKSGKSPAMTLLKRKIA